MVQRDTYHTAIMVQRDMLLLANLISTKIVVYFDSCINKQHMFNDNTRKPNSIIFVLLLKITKCHNF